jgi:tRNA pseudouridine38-40 synthase
MRNLKLVIEYDGTSYNGWQSQRDVPTIQDTLETCLAQILNHDVRINGSGRTDSGVHALGQVANLETSSCIALPQLLRGANSLLPPDILIRDVEEVSVDFHARFSATSRLYEYRIWNALLPSVFNRNFSWWVRDDLDVSLMQGAALHLLGRKDFSSFQGADHEKTSPVKEVMMAVFRQEGAELVFRIQANAFLRHMVRNIVGTLVSLGKKKISEKEFVEIIRACDRRRAGITAPARGLFLMEVHYETP